MKFKKKTQLCVTWKLMGIRGILPCNNSFNINKFMNHSLLVKKNEKQNSAFLLKSNLDKGYPSM